MPQERPLSLLLFAVGLATSACVTALPAQRPDDTFVSANGPVSAASEDEKRFLEDVNKELVKQGWLPATPGENEMKAARIVTRTAFEQRWSSSGVKSSPPDATSEKPLRAWVPKTAPQAPVYQYATAYGVVPDFAWAFQVADYSTDHLGSSDLEDLVRSIRPRGYVGQARLGVSILPDPADAHRIFAIVMRDERVNITKGAPRVATPGTSISIEGRLLVPSIKPSLWILLPDGKPEEASLTMGEGGSLSASYTLPPTPGLYLVSISGGTGYEVPVFSGVEPTPWPPRPADDAAPPGDPRDAATQVVQALENWRVRHGLSVLPVKADLCAAAKSEATVLGIAEAKNRGSPMDYTELPRSADRLRAANLDPSRVAVMNLTWRDDEFIYFLARFPEQPATIGRLMAPDAEGLGVGVTYLPRESQDDPNFFRMVWMVSSTGAHTPVQPAVPGQAPKPPEPAKPQGGTPQEPTEKSNDKLPQEGQPPEREGAQPNLTPVPTH
jgi:hypothetical protein